MLKTQMQLSNTAKKNDESGATEFIIQRAFEYFGLKVLGNGLVVDSNGNSVPYPKDKVIVFMDRTPKNEQDGATYTAIDACLREMIENKMREEELKIIQKVGIYTEDKEDNLRKFCTLLVQGEEGSQKEIEEKIFVYSFVIENFIRQIKQKMHRQKVYEHIIPIFVGKQGFWKSELIRKFLSPLGVFASEISFSGLTDTEKNYPMFARCFALLCEELAGANKAEIETFKYVVTANTLDVRIYHSQNRTVVPNKSTVIGTSNRPSSEVIKDPTGSRRVFDICIKKKMIPKNFEQIDIIAMWQGVKYELSDAELEQFYEIIETRIRPLQEANKFYDLQSEFIETCNLIPGDNVVWYTTIFEVYKDYVQYTNQKNSLSLRLFSKQLRERFNFNVDRKDNRWGIRINLEAFKNGCCSWNYQIPRDSNDFRGFPNAVSGYRPQPLTAIVQTIEKLSQYAEITEEPIQL